MSRVDEVYAALDRLERVRDPARRTHPESAMGQLRADHQRRHHDHEHDCDRDGTGQGGSRVAVSTGQVAGPDDAAQLAAGCAGAVRRAPVTDAADLISGEEVSGFGVGPHTIAAARTDVMQSAVGAFLGAGGRQFGYAELDSTTTYLATTAGVCERHVQDTTRLESSSCCDAAGSTWWGANHLRIDPEAVNRQAQERLALQSGREDAQPGRHRVILNC